MINFIAAKLIMGRQDRSVSEVTNFDADKWGSIPDRDIFFTATAHLVTMGTFPCEKMTYFVILMSRY